MTPFPRSVPPGSSAWLISLVALTVGTASASGPPDSEEVFGILQASCLDCHSSGSPEGGVDLERFASMADVMSDRAAWQDVFDVLESGQMPLPDSGYELTSEERESLMRFVSTIQALPDPKLGLPDPGKPVLRRLTRLEYNNTVRDLFGLDIDLFMFPERLPIRDKRYFLEAEDSLGHSLVTALREYGAKYDVLLPQLGLPGDHRAEHGFAARGDAMNLSPMLLEQYLKMAAEIVNSERLHRESRVMTRLLGVAPPESATNSAKLEGGKVTLELVEGFAPRGNVAPAVASESSSREEPLPSFVEAHQDGVGGVIDMELSQGSATLPQTGGLLEVFLPDSDARFTINPNADLWLASFATARSTSGNFLLANKIKGEKTFELTFAVEDNVEGLGIARLSVVLLARRNQSGDVTLTAKFSNGTRTEETIRVDESTGNLFVSFEAPLGATINKLKIDGSQYSGDYVLLDDFGFILNGKPEKKDRVAEVLPENAAELPPLERRLAEFLTRAFRRTVDAAEIDAFLTWIESSKAAGVPEEDAIRRVVQAVLTSPHFLFVSEPATTEAGLVRRLNDFEVANRLSYFLWASMPDQELLDAAQRGSLVGSADQTAASGEGGKDSPTSLEELKQQVRRMLADRGRARELSESFAVQWLRLDQLYSAKPDRDKFSSFYAGPQGKQTLHGPLLVEPLLLFETMLVEDRSVLDLIDPQYTWLNEKLAEHYGLEKAFAEALAGTGDGETEKISDSVWVRCELPDRRRGGVMTMGASLTLTSLPTRTSPVKRGAWLLETILNRPPTEPKVAFVLEEEDGKTAEPLAGTVRERFERHRDDPNCMACHRRLDPPGFSLEAFDATGAWRTMDGDQPVDATGTWNGAPFNGPAEFKQVLMQREHEFVRGFVEHLLSYALGRKLEHFDMPAVAQIVEQAKASGYRFSAVVEGIVTSYPFLHTRNEVSGS